ncbi:MAG: hypothetical protein ACREBV_02535 [Candidatus Zixiibacteriota bacterium]
MKNSRLVAITLSCWLVFAGCTDKVPTAPIKAASVRNFPNTIGRSWTYHVIDNLQPVDPNKPDPVIDTFSVTIDRLSTDPQSGLTATVWTYERNRIPIPEKLVVIKADTVYKYWNWQNSDKVGLVFPFDYRDSWETGGFLSGDRTTVTDTLSLRVQGGNFPRVYELVNERRTTVSTDKRTMTFWFVPDFGFIKIHIHEVHALSVGDTTWTLVSHNNPDF